MSLDFDSMYEATSVDTCPTKCLRLGRIVYVPAYTTRGYFALPGGGFISGSDLVARGAEDFTMDLWRRRPIK